jgi:hypothetical protein
LTIKKREHFENEHSFSSFLLIFCLLKIRKIETFNLILLPAIITCAFKLEVWDYLMGCDLGNICAKAERSVDYFTI